MSKKQQTLTPPVTLTITAAVNEPQDVPDAHQEHDRIECSIAKAEDIWHRSAEATERRRERRDSMKNNEKWMACG